MISFRLLVVHNFPTALFPFSSSSSSSSSHADKYHSCMVLQAFFVVETCKALENLVRFSPIGCGLALGLMYNLGWSIDNLCNIIPKIGEN